MKLGPTAPVANCLLNAALAWLAPVAAWVRGTAGSREWAVVIYGWFPGSSKPQVFGNGNVIEVEGLVSAERSLIAMACRPAGLRCGPCACRTRLALSGHAGQLDQRHLRAMGEAAKAALLQ